MNWPTREKTKLCKRHQAYMAGRREEELRFVRINELKKMLTRCSHDFQLCGKESRELGHAHRHDRCKVCDDKFFPFLRGEMSAVIRCFNRRAQRLLRRRHLTVFGFWRRYCLCFKGEDQLNHVAQMQEAKDLVMYAIFNSSTISKILTKYDMIHVSKKGQEFRSNAQNMRIEVLQSPWLLELTAFHMNRMQQRFGSPVPGGHHQQCCSLAFDDNGRPTLSYTLSHSDSLKITTDLTCSICWETLFDPVSLACGHLFCNACACRASSVKIVDGLKLAHRTAKCALCRRAGVYRSAVRLDELNMLLKRNCRKEWRERFCSEKAERCRQTMRSWECQFREFWRLHSLFSCLMYY